MRIVFFGTPEFAVPSLAALVAAGRPPALVVTQPERPAGRGQRRRQPLVAAWAEAHGLVVSQPPRVREEPFLAELNELAPDLAVVVAFGQIFPRELLALPAHGCINVHASLLPRWRGAAPVQAAIRAGDAETGVATMLMDEGLDTGPVLLEARTPLHGLETAGALSARLAHLGAATLLATVDGLAAGELAPRPQEGDATYAPRLDKEAGRIGWDRPAAEVFAHLRAMLPWPGPFTELAGERLKVLWGEPVAAPAGKASPGTVLELRDGRLLVACGDGVLGLEEVQRPGRRAVSAADLWNGERLRGGESLR